MVSQTKWLGYSRDRLTVIEYLGKLRYNKYWWKCRCDCGGEINLTSSQVKKGPISCGCFRIEKLLVNRFNGYKHGLSEHRLYTIYHSMIQRCYNPNAERYEYYGGKEIRVCDEWLDNFINFYNWAVSNGYNDNLSIDREDSDKDYHPDNCRWLTLSENTKRCNETKTRRDDGTFKRRAERIDISPQRGEVNCKKR